MVNTVVIGIGGASCSGKSTLSEWLVKIFPRSAVYHQDIHYLSDSKVPVMKGIQDWDCAESLNFDAFVQDLKKLPNKDVEHVLNPNRPIIDGSQVSVGTLNELKDRVKEALCKRPLTNFWFLDGFLLYYDRRVIDLISIKIALHTRYEELKRRRSLRAGYQTIEGYWTEPPNYFDEFVWPNYLKHNKPILKAVGQLDKAEDHDLWRIEELTIIDTETQPIEEVLKKAVDFILEQLLK